MNDFAGCLVEGNLTSNGRANEVVEIILSAPSYVKDLLACLDSENLVMRGHAFDAIEKIAREKPDIFLPWSNYTRPNEPC